MKDQKRYKLKLKRSSIAMLLIVLLGMVIAMPAQAVIITKGFTGLWQQPDHESQGFDFQVINQNDGVTQAVVYWYTYDTAGNPMWLLGLGDVVDDSVTMDLLTIIGVTNLQPNDPATSNEVILATASFTFDDCESGTVDIVPTPTTSSSNSTSSSNAPNSISGTGGIVRIQRLTSIKDTGCSGGISDDTTPIESSYEITQFLINTDVYPAANARARFKQSQTSTEFEVEVEGIPVGNYELSVDGEIRGQFEVAQSGTETEGKIEFESPAGEGQLLLDFDPRDKAVEVLEGSMVLFGIEFAPAPETNNDPESVGAPPYADNVETLSALTNTGFIASARGEAKLEQGLTSVEFEVEIEDLPEGNYGLYVGGEVVGVITVTNGPGGNEGELGFSFPQEAGDSQLDFDPRGKLIEVRQGDAGVILEVSF